MAAVTSETPMTSLTAQEAPTMAAVLFEGRDLVSLSLTELAQFQGDGNLIRAHGDHLGQHVSS